MRGRRPYPPLLARLARWGRQENPPGASQEKQAEDLNAWAGKPCPDVAQETAASGRRTGRLAGQAPATHSESSRSLVMCVHQRRYDFILVQAWRRRADWGQSGVEGGFGSRQPRTARRFARQVPPGRLRKRDRAGSYTLVSRRRSGVCSTRDPAGTRPAESGRDRRRADRRRRQGHRSQTLRIRFSRRGYAGLARQDSARPAAPSADATHVYLGLDLSRLAGQLQPSGW